jgi:hypothetical protein
MVRIPWSDEDLSCSLGNIVIVLIAKEKTNKDLNQVPTVGTGMGTYYHKVCGFVPADKIAPSSI